MLIGGPRPLLRLRYYEYDFGSCLNTNWFEFNSTCALICLDACHQKVAVVSFLILVQYEGERKNYLRLSVTKLTSQSCDMIIILRAYFPIYDFFTLKK